MTRRDLLTSLVVAVAAWCGLVASLGSQQARPFRPVTDAAIAAPSPNDWTAWRGTSRSQGYSPLSQVTRDNVGQLALAWSWAMEPGTQQATPLVYDGVMYLPNPGGTLQALDAASGDLLWEYRAPVPPQYAAIHDHHAWPQPLSRQGLHELGRGGHRG